MRPVERNPWPVDKNGRNKEYKAYQSFYEDLIKNFGSYCSYCERPCAVDIEHVIPKNSPKGQELVTDWNNLLCGCDSCNQDYKSNKNQSRSGYLWPDEEDTYICYEYDLTGDMKVSQSLSEIDQKRGQATIDLCGLAPKPGIKSKRQDYLRDKRMRMWALAKRFLSLFENSLVDIDLIAETAKESGFWSIWITVFNEHREVVEAISALFPGTHSKYMKSDNI